MPDDNLSDAQIRLAKRLASLDHLKRLLEPDHILIATEETLVKGAMLTVQGAKLQQVLDNYKAIAAEYHVEWSDEGLKAK